MPRTAVSVRCISPTKRSSAVKKEPGRACECDVLANDEVARNTFRLTVSGTEQFFNTFAPGQFAHIEIPDAAQLLLRRPFSIFGADREKNEVSFVYGIRGKGTYDLSRTRPGDRLNMLMPLGHGFRIDGLERHIWLAGGGLGSAALGSVAQRYPGIVFEGFFGFRSAEDVFINSARPAGLDLVEICTEDGSAGHKGVVTDVLEHRIQTEAPDAIFACGPAPFYRRLWEICKDSVPVQISVEGRMGCGTGGCETCVCPIKGTYRRTCTEGPVFDLSEVDEYVS